MLIKEIDGLTLTKYSSELRAAVLEGVSGTTAKGKADIEGTVQVITHLHTRLTPEFYPGFLPDLLGVFNEPSNLAPAKSNPTPAGPGSTPVTTASDKEKEKEEKERISRLRPVFRLVAELALVGAFDVLPIPKSLKGTITDSQQMGPHVVLERVQALMTNDPQYNNIPLLVTFLKSYKTVYLGAAATGVDMQDEGEVDEELVAAEYTAQFRSAFETYYKTCSKALYKGQVKLLEQDKRNQEAYIKAGEIFEDRSHTYERMVKAVEKLQNGIQNLADLLNYEVPKAPSAASILGKSSLQIVESGSAFANGSGGDQITNTGIWDDDEERKFYEDILDLGEEVPPSFLGLSKEATSGSAAEQGLESSAQEPPDVVEAGQQQDAPMQEDSLQGDESHEDFLAQTDLTADDQADPLQAGPAARLATIFASLPEANNMNVIDKLAVDFAYINSKAARKKVWKFLGSVPKTRTDLLPHYSRFAAILNRYMPDIGIGLISVLDEEFKYLQRKRLVKELDSVRIKNIRYYGELAKFKVAQPHTTLHVLQTCLSDLSGPNIDNVANLLESCGRFLLRSEDTQEKTKALIEVLKRKQSAQHFDPRQRLVLENAYYQCNPPERVQREQIQLTPNELFIQHLLHDVLTKQTIEKVLKLCRKLHWEDPETLGYLYKHFGEVWRLKYGSIPLIATLVHDLSRYHPEFTLNIVDQVLEDVRSGMEDNIFQYNQRRISTIKYLGELYMYRAVNTPVIFDVLWSLISFGHAEGLPVPRRSSPIDAHDDFFRIRLVCALLDTCGACFNKGSSKKKLDHFLVIFQLYVLCKAELPMEIDFMVADTLEMLRPKIAPFKTFEEAAEATDELLASLAEKQQDLVSTMVGKGEEEEEEESEGESDTDQAHRGGQEAQDEDMDVDAVLDGGGSAAGSDGEEDSDDVENDHDDDEDDESDDELDEEALQALRAAEEQAEFDRMAEEEFNREFSRMLVDTTEVRRNTDRKTAPPVFDTAVPLIRKKDQQQSHREEMSPGESGHMQFSLLSKRGNKQQVSLDNVRFWHDYHSLHPAPCCLVYYRFVHSRFLPTRPLPSTRERNKRNRNKSRNR